MKLITGVIISIGLLITYTSYKIASADDDYWTFIEAINKDRYHGAGSVLVSNGDALVYDVGRSLYQGKIAAELKNFPAKLSIS